MTRDVYAEIDELRETLHSLLTEKRATLKAHSEEIEYATTEIHRHAEDIKRLAAEVGVLLDV